MPDTEAISAQSDVAESIADTPAEDRDERPEEEPLTGFEAFGFSPEIMRAVRELGFDSPTPVQEQAIPLLLEGRDVIAEAPTGTGKTAAYGLPIIERLDEDELRVQALVVVPTRELAIQVSEAVHSFGKYRGALTVPIYGGQPYERQFRALRQGVQVVAGTPGRLLDHIGRGTLNLSGVRTVVLDEADEMLDMGFIEDLEAILAALPEVRQGALFSATIPPRIARLAQQYLRDPARISVASRQAVAPLVHQVYYEVPYQQKPDALTRILDLEEPESAIVFVRTRRDADTVAEQLDGQGYVAQAIHGDITQSQRERVLNRFRAGSTQLLVATDVAARGLDIPEVSHIINYDLPMDAEMYVHRIGRTGRAGRTGEAITLVTPRERRQLRFIERAIHRRLEQRALPTPADVAARRRESFREEVLRILDAGQLDPFVELVQDLADTRDPAELAAAAFKMAVQAREGGRQSQVARRTRVHTGTVTPPAPPRRGDFGAPRDDRPERRERFERAERPERFERAERPERFERPAERRFERPPAAASQDRRDRPRGGGGMTRLFLRVGRRDGVRPADIVGAIANESGVPGDSIGEIDLYDTFSFVEVPAQDAGEVIEALNGTTIRGRDPRAVPAHADDQRPEREGGFDRGRDGGFDRGREGGPDRGRGGGFGAGRRDEYPRRDREGYGAPRRDDYPRRDRDDRGDADNRRRTFRVPYTPRDNRPPRD